MIVLYIFGIGFIIGFIKYLLIPIIQASKHGWIDGINGTTTYKSLYFDNVENVDNTEENQAIEDEITHLWSMVERYNQMSNIIENELESCTDDKKRVTLLNRLNTIDNQTYQTRRKIDKLKEKLD